MTNKICHFKNRPHMGIFFIKLAVAFPKFESALKTLQLYS
jgi:hypothetical protein